MSSKKCPAITEKTVSTPLQSSCEPHTKCLSMNNGTRIGEKTDSAAESHSCSSEKGVDENHFSSVKIRAQSYEKTGASVEFPSSAEKRVDKNLPCSSDKIIAETPRSSEKIIAEIDSRLEDINHQIVRNLKEELAINIKREIETELSSIVRGPRRRVGQVSPVKITRKK